MKLSRAETRGQAEPKRPSILRRLFTSPTKTSPSNYQGCEDRRRIPPHRTSSRPTQQQLPSIEQCEGSQDLDTFLQQEPSAPEVPSEDVQYRQSNSYFAPYLHQAEFGRPPSIFAEQEESRFSSLILNPVLPQEPRVHPKIFGWTEDHLILGPTDEDILVTTNPLGHGSLGVVEEVRHIGGQFPTFVRKRVKLPLPKTKAAAYLKIVQEEARILRTLVHPHIVTLIGSYEDMKQSRRPSYCLLMSPVGENDLETFLTIVGEHEFTSEFSIRSRKCIRNWMACLASALTYMHASGVRHQDIKPSNIIHKGDHIFFTDFSSSSSFKVGHTTSTENPTRSTPMYGAPEVTSERGKHGRTTDIFSLGCVFSDILSVVEGRTVLSFQDYLRSNGNAAATDTKQVSGSLKYSEKIQAIKKWFSGSLVFNTHVSHMLHPDRKLRPAATEVLQAFVMNDVCDASCSCLWAKT